MKALKENLKKTRVLISKSKKHKGWYNDQEYKEWIYYDSETKKQYKKTIKLLKEINYKDKKIKNEIAKLPCCLINYSITIIWICAILLIIQIYFFAYLQIVYFEVGEVSILFTFLVGFLLIATAFRVTNRAYKRNLHIHSTLYDIEELLRNQTQKPQALKTHSKNINKSTP